jgi:drug/metabolite transporter (DMT)-like permease
MQNAKPDAARRAAALVIICYVTVYLVWGSTYFFIRQAVLTIPPFYVVGLRWTVGGVLLLLFALATGRLKTLPTVREILSSLALGFFLLLIGNGLISVAELKIDSYIAALLAASTPILVAFFDRFLLKKPITLLRVAGIVGGFLGVALLLYNGRSIRTSLDASILIGMAGVLSWSFATSLGHRFPVHGDNLVNSGIQMLFVGVVALAGSLLFDRTPSVVIQSASVLSLLSVLYLAVIGAIAFAAYTFLVSREPASRVVSYALVNPLIALLLGLGLGRESATPFLWIGVPLVLLALLLMLYGERILERLRGPRSRGMRRGAPRK